MDAHSSRTADKELGSENTADFAHAVASRRAIAGALNDADKLVQRLASRLTPSQRFAARQYAEENA